jgi:hypothetical protein
MDEEEDLAKQLKEKIRLKALWIELLAEAEAEANDIHIVDKEEA